MIRYMLWRQLPFVILVLVIAGVIGFYITNENNRQVDVIYQTRVAVAQQTAIANALYAATRTAEAPMRQYRLLVVTNGTPLYDVAQQYQTTVDVLRMANGLLPNVDYGDGSEIIVPEGVSILLPPRTFSTVKANVGDTLQQIAKTYGLDLELLQVDNPILAARGVNPGDIVFLPKAI